MTTPTTKPKVNVLFVCLGNICRSPMAEAVFRSLSSTTPYVNHIGTVDSAGTGAYHELDPPDPRTMQTLAKNSITDYDHAARKVRKQDFAEFDWVFAMDDGNLRDLRRLGGKGKVGGARVCLFGEFAGDGAGDGKGNGNGAEGEEVVDPYYGGDNGFDAVFEQVSRFSRNFLKALDEEREGSEADTAL